MEGASVMRIEQFNEQADALLSDLLDRAEARLVRNGVCKNEMADEHMTLLYIGACAGLIKGAVQYLFNDEALGADIFLWQLGDRRFKRWSTKRQQMCAVQLAGHTHVYFPKYHAILNLTFRHVLQTRADDRHGIAHSGILLLAAATLPGARSAIRRELRRLGIVESPTLVSDSELNSKQLHLASQNEMQRLFQLVEARGMIR